MNTFATHHAAEIEQVLAKYPPDRKQSAVMPLLHMAQRETGYVTKQAVIDIAEIVGVSTTEVASIIGFYTLYHDHPEGRYRFQICTDLPCALRGADQFLQDLCKALQIKPGETTKDGLITVEEVKCLAACHRAPMFQVQRGDVIKTFENQTVETALVLVDEFRQKEGSR
jgi:NADH-quinone oxidoreductase E subunit